MNTISSVWYGWGFFILMGGSGYYLAKRSIAKDRLERQRQDNEKTMRRNRQIAASGGGGGGEASGGGSAESGGGPSTVATTGSSTAQLEQQQQRNDDDTTRKKKSEGGATRGSVTSQAAPGTGGKHVKEKSRFEASEPYRSRKGDRFS